MRVKTLLILMGLLLGVSGTVAAGIGAGGYSVKLDFTNADGLNEGNDVLIGGVKAGRLQTLSLGNNVAVATVSLDSQFTPLHSGTKALIRSLGLLGNHYIEIVPGTGEGTLSDGSEIGVDSTTSPTDLDQINAIFDAPTRDKLKAMTLQGKIALGGRAQILNRDLEQLRNLAKAAEPAVGILDDHQVTLDRATVAFDTLTQKLAVEDASLRGFVQHGSSVLDAIQQQDVQLAGLLQHGDATFTRLDQALAGNENYLAGFFARQPAVEASSNYSVLAGIPVLKNSASLIVPLDQLLYDMADATTGINGTTDPNQLSSTSVWALRPLAVICKSVAPSDNGANGQC